MDVVEIKMVVEMEMLLFVYANDGEYECEQSPQGLSTCSICMLSQ